MSDVQLRAAAREYLRILQAREDSAAFVEYVLVDQFGYRIEMGDLHRVMHAFIRLCWWFGVIPWILAPMGHGKSVQVPVGLGLWLILSDPNLRVKVISNAEDVAKGRTSLVREYITGGLGQGPGNPTERLRTVFPGRTLTQEAALELTLTRTGASMDPSFRGAGVFSSGTGGRADVHLYDDVVDYRNAVLNPGDKKRVRETFFTTWQTRLEPPFLAAGVGTTYAADDLYAHLKRVRRFAVLEMPVAHDESCLLARIYADPGALPQITADQLVAGDLPGVPSLREVLRKRRNEPHPEQTFQAETRTATECREIGKVRLWEPKWNKHALRAKKAEDAAAYGRGYQLVVVTDGQRKFPSLDTAFVPQSPDMLYRPGWDVYVGVDPATAARPGTGIVAYAINPDTRQRVMIHCERPTGSRGWDMVETLAKLRELDDPLGQPVWGLETVAFQKEYQTIAGHYAAEYPFHDRIVGIVTGSNKNAEDVGIPALAVELANGSWVIPTGHLASHTVDCGCGWCQFIREARDYPEVASNDMVMAWWVGRMAERKAAQKRSEFAPMVIRRVL